MKIVMTESEQRIVGLIRKFADSYNNEMTLRIAGGWVRDKLLGIES